MGIILPARMVADDDGMVRNVTKKQYKAIGSHPDSLISGATFQEAKAVPARVMALANKHGHQRVIALFDPDIWVAVSWCCVSVLSAVSIVVLNKQLMKQLPTPAFVTCVQYVAMSIALEVMANLGVFSKRSFPAKRLKLRVALSLIIGFAPAVSNMSLQYNSVGTYQIFKTLQTPAIACGEYLLQGKTVSPARGLWLTAICGCVSLATVSDVELRMFGMIVAISAIALSTLYKVSTAQLQQDTNADEPDDTEHSKPWGTLQLMHALLPLSTVALGLMVLSSNELVLLQTAYADGLFNTNLLQVDSSSLVLWIGGSAVLAFTVTLSQFKMCQCTSALTASLVGQFKSAALIVGSFVAQSNNKSYMQVGGAAGALLCFFFYSQQTMKERAKHRESVEELP